MQNMWKVVRWLAIAIWKCLKFLLNLTEKLLKAFLIVIGLLCCWAWLIRGFAEQGNAGDQNRLGAIYLVVLDCDAKAAEWFSKAAEQGHVQAQNNLARLYLEGRGVEQSDAKAAEWFVKAAEQGNAQAQYALGQMYQAGRGVEQSDAQAAEWFRKAADQGVAEADAALRGSGE